MITGYLRGILLARAALSIFFFSFHCFYDSKILYCQKTTLNWVYLKNHIGFIQWFMHQAASRLADRKFQGAVQNEKTYGRGNRNKEVVLDFKNKNKPYWLLWGYFPLVGKIPLEKEMATHSSILAWKISWTVEPGGLQSMGSQRVGYNWATNTYLHLQN